MRRSSLAERRSEFYGLEDARMTTRFSIEMCGEEHKEEGQP